MRVAGTKNVLLQCDAPAGSAYRDTAADCGFGGRCCSVSITVIIFIIGSEVGLCVADS
jgi:hypothetical protein